jgi:nucleoside-diphosphate-sugar epimerase
VIHLAGPNDDAHNAEGGVEGAVEGSVERAVEESAERGVEEGGAADASRTPYTLMETANATCSAVIGVAVEPGAQVERFVYVSSAAVFERASEFPTSEAHLAQCPAPESSYGFAMLAGEMFCRAAHEEHGLRYTICRPCDVYGPGMALETGGAEGQTRTPTHVDDVASGVIAAMGAAKGVNEDFNIAAARELTVAEIARIVWETCGEDSEALATEPLPKDTTRAQRRSWPSAEKARRLLGWEARIEVEEGIAATVEWIRAQGSVGSAT